MSMVSMVNFQAIEQHLVLVLVWGLCGILSSTLATASTVISTQQTDTLDCDFENGFCGWKEVSKSLYNKWTRKAADDNRWRVDKKYRPFSDHTLGEGFGQFAYVSLGDKYNISPLRLDSPVVTMPEKGICFQFWYLMNGPSVADLNVYITPSKKSGNGKSTLVWTASGTRGVDWRPSRIHIQDFKGEAYITVETVVDRYHKTYPALDDFSMIYGHCPPSNTCDFEEDHFCSYTQSTSDDLDWSLSTLDTWVPKEGPKTDHTFETKLGHYAFINASTPRSSGNKAVLMTNPFLATTYSCLSFWYNMEGDSVGTLNIKLIYNGMGNDSNTILWTKSGDQGGDWLLTHVDVSSPVLYTIGFEGIIGDGDGGTIAIDDVGIKPGICPARGSCDFEEDFCTWRNNPGDDFEWEKVAPRHVGIPRHDHSLFTPFGHYLYLDPNGQRQGDLAKYLSPPLEKRTSYCLNLWYFATEKGNLTIITQDTVTNIEESVVFNKTKKENSWFPIRQTVGPCKNDFLIVIIGTISTYYSYDAEIGIDDLAIQEGACESLPTPNHTRNAFQCSEGTFISRREICDFKNDCMKGEDEQSCGYNCNFENKTTCGWSSTTKSGWYWAVESGAISSKHRDPKTDNTLGTIDGQYLNLNGDYGSKHALLRSPLLQRTAPNCELMFYFYYHNVSYRDFTVEKVMGSETLDLFSGQVTDNLATWNRVILPLGLTNVPFRINLIGKRYMDSDASVAVDDIYFRNCAYPEPHVSCTPENTFVCENKACVHPALLCNYVDDCGDGSDEGDEMCQSYHRCNFESDVCLWRQGKDQVDIDWTLDDASSNRFTEGPTFDHTTSMDFGHYMNINHRMSNRVAGDKAWLLSPVLQSSGLCTLTLYLFMNGDESHRFSVYTRSSTNGSLIPVFNRTGGGGELWMPVNVQLIRPKAFQIILEGVLGSYDDGYIAVDDIILSPRCRIVLKDQLASERTTIGVQTSPTLIEPTTTDVSSIDTSLLDCDFENGFCGWKEVSKSLYNKWTRKAADDNRWRVDKKYRPFSDHTLGEGFGQFAYVSLGYKYNISPLRLDSPVVTMPEKGICFQFWYLMNGPSVADLNVYITPSKKSGNGKSTLVWTASGTRGVDWRPSRIHIQDFKGEAYITVETVVDRYHKTYPALDDFSMIYGHCPPSNTCDFEENHFCSYTQSTSDDLDWSLSTLDTWVPIEGPKTDHTFETKLGHYAFINASTPRSSGNKAVLMTNPFLATTYSCLSFWYNMEGDSVGTLNIKLIYNGVGNDSNTILWTKSGDQGGDWLLTHVDVSSPVLYTIGFEGIIGDGDGGTIAIDDVGIKPGICPARGSCDFEEDFCTWRNNPGDDFEWEKVAPRHVGIPRHDHSLFTPFGHYLYLDPNGQRQGDLAKYLSPPLEKRTSYCLNLWYFATEKGNLTIITQDTVTNIEESVVFNKTKKENSWFPIRQTVGPCKNDFLIVIIGTISTYYSYDAEIGIDDLAIQEGACESLPTPNHTRNAFQCSEGTFISRREICDFKNDCMKGEDEQSCGYNCNFENKTTCGWSSTTKSGWYWAVESGAISSKHRDPKTDNTLGTIDGQYLNLNGDYGSKHALLRSPLLQRTAPNCELMFYFYYHNVSYRDFTVEKVMGSETLDLFSGQVTDNLATWNRVILPLGLTNVPFRINLIGKRYMDSDASVAVDDIYFRNCAYPEPHVSCTPENTFVCENKACVHPALLCNYVDDCGDGSDEGDEMCQSYHRCNFESDVCLWRQGKDQVDIDWTLDDASSNRFTEGPTFDHTTSMDFGHYMNINHRMSNRVAGDKAWLLSPVLQSSGLCTLTLYLFMNGDESHRFSVYTRSSTNGSLIPVFNRTGGGGELWMPVNVQLIRPKAFQIILEGVLGSYDDGYIAVDDIILSPRCRIVLKDQLASERTTIGVQTSPTLIEPTTTDVSSIDTSLLDCDFENGFCGWKEVSKSLYNKWTRKAADDNRWRVDKKYRPFSDHTLGEGFGQFAYVSLGYKYNISPLRLDSPVVTMPEKGICFQFWYLMNGPSVADLNVYITPSKKSGNGKSTLVWTASGTRGVDWRPSRIHIQDFKGEAYITVETVVDRYHKTYPALDDFSMIYGHCPPSNTCDFEENHFCSYTQSTSDDLDWSLSTLDTWVPKEGPKTDHTFETKLGHYAFINASTPRSSGNKAVLMTNPFLATTYSCLSFWYNMEGDSVGTLNIKLIYNGVGNDSNTILWTKSGDQGGDWLLTHVDVSSPVLYTIGFEGIIGDGDGGTIAIDDVGIKPGICPARGSCDFEEDFCTWRNNPGDDFEWEKVAPRHVGIPRHDHSLFTPFGHYLYLDPNGQRQGDLAKYLSPPLEKRTSYCLNLWYFATEKGNLTIITQDTVTNIEESVVFNKTKKENSWFPIRQTVGPCKNDFLIVIIGTISTYYSYDAEIGIDDLAIQEGACESLPTPNHTRNAFQCSEGTFISRREICDFKNDCMKGEDEQSCGYNCNFENKTTCGWSSTTKSGWYWAVESGAISSKHRDPKTDNTLGTIDGQYLNLNGDYGSKHALLRSPLLQRTAPNCELMFYFYYHNVSYRDFTVEKVMGSETLDLFSGQVTDNLATWNRVILPLGLTNVPFRINLIGKRYMDSDASVAVDDIYFRNCAYPEPHVSCTPENTFVCENKACVHPALLCNYVDDCGDGSDEGDEMCQSYHRCNFESDVCLWRQGKDQVDIDWTLDDASSNRFTEGPTFDHTTSMDFGHYMNINHRMSNRVAGDKAWLLSPVLQSSGLCTLTLYLFMNGDESHRFSVYTRSSTNGSLIPVFNRTGGGGELWMPVNVQLIRPKAFQIILEGVLGSYDDGYIAVDDIILSPRCRIVLKDQLASERTTIGVQTSPTLIEPTTTDVSSIDTSLLDCDFENGFCGWKEVSKSLYNKWTRKAADDNRWRVDKKYRPFSDHTLGEGFGQFAYVSLGYKYNISPLRLDSPVVTMPEKGICFQFWYLMNGPSVADLNVYITPSKKSGNGKSTLVWTASGTRGVDWRPSRIHIQDFKGEAYITVETVVDRYHKTYPALDDFSMIYGHCPPSNTCDFEENHFCSYTQSMSDDLDWSLSTLDTWVPKEGPKTDHTFETKLGHYAFINASTPRSSGNKAVLMTNPFLATTYSCLSFWYNMEGDSVGTLNIKLIYNGVGNDSNTILWTKSGDQGGDWLLTHVDVSSPVLYTIGFEGIIGDGDGGTIAIDDVGIKPGICPARGSCDFEEDFCTWRNNPGDDFEWEKVAPRHVGIPRHDHSLFTPFGHYLYLDPNGQRQGDLAKYLSPPLEKRTSYCLNLWYFATEKGNLTIITQDTVTNIEESVVFNKTKKENSWFPIRQTVGPCKNDFLIVIIGTISTYYSYDAEIGIDDLAIQEGACESLPTPNHTRNAFQCSEGTFISRREICDFKNDCMKGEDEQSCGYNCNFENKTTCGWSSTTKSGWYWAVESGAISSKHRDPKTDNTLGTIDGQYLNLNGDYGSKHALLRSPLLQRTAPNCELMFYFYYHNVSYRDFTVEKVMGSETLDLFSGQVTDNLATWNRVILPLGLTNVPFRINLIGERYMDSDASVAVDDIYFRNCAYPEPHVSCTHENTFVCENKACVHPALLCNYVDDCGDGSDEGDEVCQSYHRCNFESDVCFWRQGKDIVDIDWTLDDAIGNDYTEGPTFDHTTSMDFGHYMNINHRKSNRVAGDKAWLFSPVLQSSRICTLTLYLFMNGDESHRFSVYTRSSTNGSLTPVFNRTGGGGELWMPVYVHLKRSTIFQIILEGTLGLNIDGYIAVDDIILSHGCMPSSNTLPTLKPIVTTTTLLPCGDATLWQCSDMSQCIYRFELCDFIVQCADGSDERDCGACDFESSTCGWVDRTRGRYIWDRMNTLTTDVQGKPKTDHTEARVNVGYYVIVHSKGYGYARPVLLESPILGSTEANCVLVFYYQMSTSYFGRLSLELYPKEITNYERNSGIVLWRRSKVVKTWIKQTVSIGSRAAGFRIVFRFSNIQYMKSLVGPALDDISFSSGCGAGKPSVFCEVGEFFCQISKECKPMATRCDLAKDCKHGEDEEECKQYTRSSFEQGSHTFSNYLRDSSNFWKLGQPSLFPGEAAPDRDHTFGNETGHYMYIEMAASSQVPSSIARLKGPVMYGNKEGTCHMRLFYHLNGNYKDAINVYTETREGGLLKTVWSANKEHGDEWKKTDIPLVENTLFRVIIEGVRDADYRGDIAIDDVSFTPSCVKANGHSLPPYIPMPNHGSCKQGLEFPCDGKCKSVKNWCDFKVDCLDGSDEMSCPSQCDFESGICGWKKLPRSVNWEIAQVKTDVDHNPGTKTGSVLKTELKYQNKAILESPFFRASSHNCSFSFWFKYGGSDATLFLKLKSFDNEETLLHLEIRKPVTKWSLKTVSLPSCQENFQLFFSAISYSSQELPMLLDDFTFNGCAVVPSKDRCMPGEFRCSNGLCISRDRLCDLGNDCCDYSDEEYALCHRYRKMTFETGMGGWKQKTGYETWYRESLNSGDHTFSLPGGHFIYFRCNGETSILAHDMPQPSGTCIVRFWYRLKSSVANITMSIDPHFGEPFSVAAFPGYSKIKYHTWIRAELKIDLKEKYSLVLVGHCTISSSSGAIDVDDIVFSPGCFTQSSPPIQPTTPSTTLQPTPPSTTLQPTTSSTTLQPTTPSTNLQPTTPSTSLQPTTPSTTLQPTTQSTTLQTTTPSPTLQTTTPSTTLQPTTLQSSRSICPKKLKFQCVSDGQCISDNKHCDFNIDCVDTSDEADCNTINVCDFDKDLCGWRENESDNLYWKRGSTQDVPNEQGPLFDASGTSGSYVYIRHSSNVQQTNKVARLVSKYFQAAAAGCTIEFYYFIIGADPGTLSLDIRSGLGDVEPLWQTDMQSNSWVMAIVGVGRRFSNFSLAFVQKPRSDSFRGQVAIDKIKFSDSCRELHVEKYECKYQDRMYRCSRGACVLNSELCDGQDDCGDGSDESSQLCQGFTREDFESLAFPFGSLFQSDDLNWSVWNRSMIVPSGLLGVDHSTGSSRGHYIYIANTKGKDTAWLLSKPFRATESGKACQVRLFVLLPTEQQTIQVGYRTLGSSQLHITYTHPKGKVYGSYWQRVALTFDDVSRPYQVVFKASPGCPEGSLAIDDVTFGPHCRPVHRNVGSTTATNGDTHDQSEHSTGSVNDGEWKTPVGVVIGILVSVSLLAGVVVYMYRTGRIRGSRFGFKAFGEYPMQPVKEPVCHVNPLYMDAMSEPESSILNDEASAL